MRFVGWSSLLIVFSSLPVFAQQGAQPAAPAARPAPPPVASNPPATDKDRASYGFGVMVGRDLLRNMQRQQAAMQKQGVEIDVPMVLRGIIDGIANKSVLSEQQLEQAMASLEAQAKRSRDQRDAQRKVLAAKNKKEGEAFLAANKNKPGVKTLPSGLQYKVLKSGNGPQPKKTDRVRAHYQGSLINGTVFDSSIKRGQPVELGVGEVIPGWTEALQLMHVGDKWQLFIPANLGYGERGAGNVIPPNATLIFEVELLGIVK